MLKKNVLAFKAKGSRIYEATHAVHDARAGKEKSGKTARKRITEQW